MKNKLSFKIESLLYGIENPRGGIEQVLFAQKVAKHEGMDFFDCLARLTFDNIKINKAFPGGTPTDETLVIGHQRGNGTVIHLCVRAGQSTLKIATAYLPSKEVIVHNEYNTAILQGKLSVVEINGIFNHIWKNMEQIQPRARHFYK